MNVSFISLGCDKNRVNTEQMMALCLQAGHTVQEDCSGSDVVVINTCGFIDSAKSEAIDTILAAAELKAAGEVGKILVTGCLSQRYQADILEELPEIDGIMGTGCFGDIVTALEQVVNGQECRHFADINGPVEELPRVLSTPRQYAYLRIAEGCSNRCAYCVIPSLRGKYRSRPMEGLLEEARELADAGVKEVTLLGQIVNRYGRQMETAGGKGGFVQLLEAVHEVEGIRRIRFVSPHPIGFRQDLVQAFTYLPKLCSHIHFPMQSGSDRILKMMRRPYRNETYLDLCSRMKQARPDLSITTDIIVGFPGETEEDYLLTRQAVEQVQFDNAFIFRYSPRRGTPAAVMENQIPEEVKEARNQDLLAVVNEIAIRKNRDLVGTVQEVLLEGPSKTNAARLSGRTSQNKPVMVDAAPDLAGEILPIRIEESTGFTLYGVPCPSRG